MQTLKAEKVFKAGEVIMTQGDAGLCAYFIQEGRVGIVVEKSDGKLLHMGTRGPGSIIGEMAIVDNQPRSATIKSLENGFYPDFTDGYKTPENSKSLLATRRRIRGL
jgi:CRP-like cAMP-binding protein